MDFDREWYTESRLIADIDCLTTELATLGEPDTEEGRQRVRALKDRLDERRRMLLVLLTEE